MNARASITAAALSLSLALALPVAAHPVRIGRYTEIPYGISSAHPHPMAGGDPQRTGRMVAAAPEREPTRRWERALPFRRPRGPIVAADGTLYFGTMGGLTALAPDGTERWTARIGAVHATPSLTPAGDLVAVTRNGLVALVTPDGVVRESANLGAPARGTPLVLDDGSVLVSTLDRELHRLDTNLRTVFSMELPDGASTAIARTRRGTIAIAGGSFLTLLDPDGALQREVVLQGRATAAPSIADDGTLWVPTVEGVLYAIDPSGRVRSRTDLGSRHYDGAAIAIGRDQAVRVPTITEGVVCVGPNGTERWRAANPAGYNAPIAIDAEDNALVIDRSGRLISLAPDGTERWRVTVGAYAFEAPVIGRDGTVYVATERGDVSAWR